MKVKADPPPGSLARMIEGVRLEDGPAKALEATVHEKVEKNSWIRVVVGEGRRHLVKRLCESVGLEVLRLFRPEFGGVTVARLRPGRYRDLTAEEVDTLRRSAGMLKGPRPEPSFLPLPKAARRHGHGAPEPRPERTMGPEREARPPRVRSSTARGRDAPKGREGPKHRQAPKGRGKRR